jgi:hypothetical protein
LFTATHSLLLHPENELVKSPVLIWGTTIEVALVLIKLQCATQQVQILAQPEFDFTF